jgi:hypothetical protein
MPNQRLRAVTVARKMPQLPETPGNATFLMSFFSLQPLCTVIGADIALRSCNMNRMPPPKAKAA